MACRRGYSWLLCSTTTGSFWVISMLLVVGFDFIEYVVKSIISVLQDRVVGCSVGSSVLRLVRSTRWRHRDVTLAHALIECGASLIMASNEGRSTLSSTVHRSRQLVPLPTRHRKIARGTHFPPGSSRLSATVETVRYPCDVLVHRLSHMLNPVEVVPNLVGRTTLPTPTTWARPLLG